MKEVRNFRYDMNFENILLQCDTMEYDFLKIERVYLFIGAYDSQKLYLSYTSERKLMLNSIIPKITHF